MKISYYPLNDTVTNAWMRQRDALEAEAKKLDDVLVEINKITTDYGYKNLTDFLRKRSQTLAILEGKRPAKYRRRSRDDVQRVCEMVRDGRKNKEIAAELQLAPNTVSNIKRLLKDRGELTN